METTPEYFQVDFVRLVTYGGNLAFEKPIDRFLYTHQEMDPDIFGPVRTIDLGGSRPWIKITNQSSARKKLSKISLAVIQGDATNPDPEVTTLVGVYSGFLGSHYVYVKTHISSARVTLRLRGKTTINGSFVLPSCSAEHFHKVTTFGLDYWDFRPSDSSGAPLPKDDVIYYDAVLNKSIILDPGESCYFECVCEWSSALPDEEPVTSGNVTTQDGYVFQWYPVDSCKAEMESVDPGPEPEPVIPLPPQDLNWTLGRGGFGGVPWQNGLDRLLLDIIYPSISGSEPTPSGAWTEQSKRPVLRIRNPLTRNVYLNKVSISVINGSTAGSGSTITVKTDSRSTSIAAQTARLDIYLRDPADPELNINTVLFVDPTSPIGRLVVSGVADASFWKYRPSNADGSVLYPDSTDHSLVDFYPFVLSEGYELAPGAIVYIEFRCTWNSGNHVLQWYPANSVKVPACLKITWDANGGTINGHSVMNTYPELGKPLTLEDIPTPTRGENYRFVRWDPEPDLASTVQTNKTYTAVWRQVSGSVFRLYDKVTDKWYPVAPPMRYDRSTRTWIPMSRAKRYDATLERWEDFSASNS